MLSENQELYIKVLGSLGGLALLYYTTVSVNSTEEESFIGIRFWSTL